MARLPRLAVAGEVHLLWHRGHNRQPVFFDEDDRRRFLAVLREIRSHERVLIHGYALLPESVWLLATPAASAGLGRLVQALGRRYTGEFNRRHARTGALWDGRFRSTVVAGQLEVLEALLFVDQAAVRAGLASRAVEFGWSSAQHHAGLAHDSLIADLDAYWLLGNTPFERTARYLELLEDLVPLNRTSQIKSAVQRGWALASTPDAGRLQVSAPRPLFPQKRGRPRRVSGVSVD